jgi:anti-sigma factor RsiW
VTTPDPFEHDDDAYLLGALSEPEREAFQAHLTTCDACTARVNTLSRAPTLLADITAADLAEPDTTPGTLLPGLLRHAACARRRQRWLTGGLSALAAACLIALAVAVWPSAPTSDTPRPQAMTALAASPVRATAALADRKWGTEIDLDCSYTGHASASAHRRTYGLRLIDRNGATHDLGTWTLAPGTETTFTSGTALPRNQISSIQITRPNGTPILQLTT